jgi:hypothetical protein
VRHASDAAREALRFAPALDFDASLQATEAWYRITHGLDTPSWRALQAL